MFTHFAQLGPAARGHLPAHGHDGRVLRRQPGARGARTMIERFQSREGPGALVLSLKPGGTGLNLTAASDVVLYDRWWNPTGKTNARPRPGASARPARSSATGSCAPAPSTAGSKRWCRQAPDRRPRAPEVELARRSRQRAAPSRARSAARGAAHGRRRPHRREGARMNRPAHEERLRSDSGRGGGSAVSAAPGVRAAGERGWRPPRGTRPPGEGFVRSRTNPSEKASGGGDAPRAARPPGEG